VDAGRPEAPFILTHRTANHSKVPEKIIAYAAAHG